MTTTNKVNVPFGKQGSLILSLPTNWEIIGICNPKPIKPCEDVQAEIHRALANPIGSPDLRELARGAKTVAVVVDDISRPTPIHLFFDHVLAELEAGGIDRDKITVLTGLGVHRPMTEDEIKSKIGASGANRYRVINHQFEMGDHLARLGVTSRGTEAYVHNVVAEADIVLSLGCIEPHVIAGFGGGYKNIFPGCAGKVTIAANHKLNTTPQTFNMVGSKPETNPMRCDLEECGSLLPGKVFIVNAVLDGSLRVVRIVAGHPVAAHREGIRTCQEIYGVQIPKQCDVLITCSHPMNIDLRQGFKALANTIHAVRPGGALLNLIAAEQGIGDMNLPKKLHVSKKTVRTIARILSPILGRFTFGMKEEDLFFIYFFMQVMKRNDLYIYSPNLPADIPERLPFLDIHNNIDAMLERAARTMPGNASVLVFPFGGVTYPILG